MYLLMVLYDMNIDISRCIFETNLAKIIPVFYALDKYFLQVNFCTVSYILIFYNEVQNEVQGNPFIHICYSIYESQFAKTIKMILPEDLFVESPFLRISVGPFD